MKKPNAKTVVLILFIFASVCSYAYLYSLKQTQDEVFSNKMEERAALVEDKEKTYVLPDLRILTKLAEASKRFLPAY